MVVNSVNKKQILANISWLTAISVSCLVKNVLVTIFLYRKFLGKPYKDNGGGKSQTTVQNQKNDTLNKNKRHTP